MNKTSNIIATLFYLASVSECFLLIVSSKLLLVDKNPTKPTNVLHCKEVEGCYTLDKGLR